MSKRRRLVLGVALCCSSTSDAVRKSRVTWSNGIAHSREHMDTGKQNISKLFGGKRVLFCHNPTSMSDDNDMVGYIGDLTQAGTQKLGRITEEVDELVRHLREAVKTVGRHGRVIHIAHSQGALLTYLASRQLTPLEMSQIEVIAFGGAAALRTTIETPFVRCINYYSINDPLLWLVPTASQALRSGMLSDEFLFLAPRVGDPIGDHNLFGPTYSEALAWEGHRFQRQYQSLAYRSVRGLVLLILAVLHAILQRMQDTLVFVLRHTVLPIVGVVLALLTWLQTQFKAITKRLSDRLGPLLTLLLMSLIDSLYGLYSLLIGNEKYEPVVHKDTRKNIKRNRTKLQFE